MTDTIARTQFNFVDLFAGLGGFHVALERLGGKAVFAAEWVEELADLYEKNFKLRPAGDISKVNAEVIPAHDLLAAGFPCQPFSKAGEQLGFRHTEQGELFFEVLRVLSAKRPSTFILENVPNLLTHRNGETMRLIDRKLRALGYSVAFKKYSPHMFGIPQIRDRVYIVGSLHGLDGFNWPEPLEPSEPSIFSILDDRPSGYDVSPAVLACLKVWDEFLRNVPPEVVIPRPLWSMEFGATYEYEDSTPFASEQNDETDFGRGSFGTPLDGMTRDERLLNLPSHARRNDISFPDWKVRFITRNREFYRQNKSWLDDWIPKIRDFPSSWQKLEWNVGAGERDIWKYVVQMRASGVRVKTATTSPSLVAMTPTQVPIIAWEGRYLTPREGARLQSLGDIHLPAGKKSVYKALGNAVNADVVAAIAGPLIQSAMAELRLSETEMVA